MQLRGIFLQGPLFKGVQFENGAKSHNFTIFLWCHALGLFPLSRSHFKKRWKQLEPVIKLLKAPGYPYNLSSSFHHHHSLSYDMQMKNRFNTWLVSGCVQKLFRPFLLFCRGKLSGTLIELVRQFCYQSLPKSSFCVTGYYVFKDLHNYICCRVFGQSTFACPYGETALWGSTPLTICILFSQKREPFRIPLFDEMYPFHMLS